MNKTANSTALGNTREQTFNMKDLVRIDSSGSPILDSLLMKRHIGKLGVIIDMHQSEFDDTTYDVLVSDEVVEFFPDELVLITRSSNDQGQ